MNDAPVGLFDSGLGGWWVARAVRDLLPREALLFAADAACAPWGDRTPEFILARSEAMAEALVARGAKALVVACNTATAAAIAALRARYELPIVGIEPAVKPAATLTRSGVVGVLATRHTVESERFGHLRDRYGRDVSVLARACPGLVECVEAGTLDDERVRTLLAGYVEPLLAQGADTLVLACTHYPWLTPVLLELVGEQVTIIDPAPAVARELARRLESANLCAGRTAVGPVAALTTGDAGLLRAQLARLGERDLTVEPLTSLR